MQIFKYIIFTITWCPYYCGDMNTILKPDEIVELKLIEKVEVTHDTNRYRFGFPNEDDVLGLPTGKHIALIFEDENGEQVSRSYTPVSSDVDKGLSLIHI